MKYQKFSHKTPHLKGKQHQLDPNLDLKQLVHHATVQYVDRDNDGDVDVYDNPKKKIPDENPIADFGTVSKRLIAKQKGEIKHTKRGIAYEETKSGDENLGDWFRKSDAIDPKTGRKVPGWRQIGGPFAGAPCARQPGQTSTPKCGSSKMAANLSDEEEDEAFRRKNGKDPNQPQKSGAAKPTNVATEETIIEKKDACYNKVKSRYRVWPSAYASGALVKCRKVGAKNWGNKTEETNYNSLPDWEGRIYEDEERYCPKCEKMERINECKYGPKFWLLYSSAVEPSDQMKYDLSQIYPAKKVEEEYTRIQSRGSTYSIMFNWRGKYLFAQMFFPQFARPSKQQVTYELRKIYPDAIVLTFNPSPKDPTKPLLFTGELNGSR